METYDFFGCRCRSMGEPWYLGAWWPDEEDVGPLPDDDDGDFEDTTPKPRGEIYDPDYWPPLDPREVF